METEKKKLHSLSSSESTYIKERLEDQINWYDNKSIKTQKVYKNYKAATIIISSLIPVLSFSTFPGQTSKFLVGIAGAAIAISEGFVSLNKHGENWIRYRNICETLKQEKYMFLNSSGVYSEDDSDFSFFVERIETIISQENVNWASLNKDKKTKN